MKMRLRGGKWYAAFRYKGKIIQSCLDAKANEELKAYQNLGRLIECLERGESPQIQKTEFGKLIPDYLKALAERIGSKRRLKGQAPEEDALYIRYEIALRLHIRPFFSERPIGEIAEATILEYVRHREKDNAARDTLKKELRAISDIIKLAVPAFKIPKVEYANLGKTPGRALTLDEVLSVIPVVRAYSAEFGAVYEGIYQVMAYTALDVKDALNLTWEKVDLQTGLIKNARHKSKMMAEIPISPELETALKEIGKLRRLDGRLFPTGIKPDQVSTAIRRSFKRAGLPGFSAKSLRHFVASQMASAGATRVEIASVLGHGLNSRMTDVYVHAYLSSTKAVFRSVFARKEIENGFLTEVKI